MTAMTVCVITIVVLLLNVDCYMRNTKQVNVFMRPSRTIKSDVSLNMALLTGIAEKMTGVVEFLSGQTKITEANIESTLKVS